MTLQLIFDFDDTIVKTNREFDYTNNQVANAICKAYPNLGIGAEEIQNIHRELDLKEVAVHGFIPNRFMDTWNKTHDELSKGFSSSTQKQTSNIINRHLTDLFERQYENYQDALLTLHNLRTAGYPMVILTAGADDVQKRKVQESGAGIFMDKVHVRPAKTPDTLEEVMVEHPAKDYVMIGNSLKSDIHPALTKDVWGVHLQTSMWQGDLCEVNTDHPKFKTIPALKKLPETLNEIQRKSYAAG